MTRRTTAVGLGAALALLLGTGAAGGLPPAPSADLMPGTGGEVYSMAVTGDTLYTLSYAGLSSGDNPIRDSLLFSRSVTEGVDGYQLGAATQVARASGFSMAEHDGTLGYLRRVDGRLVLRGQDGTETLPAWGNDDEIVIYGPNDMSASWLSAGSWIWNRATGTKYDLLEITPGLVHPDESMLWASVLVADSRAMWEGFWCDDIFATCDGGIFTVALGPSGPTGPVVQLADTSVNSRSVGIVGDSLVWTTWTGNNTTVSVVPVGDPTAAPATDTFTGWVSVFTSMGLAVVDATGAATWFDPTDFGIHLYHYPHTSDQWVGGVHDTLFWLYGEPSEKDFVVNVGGTLTANNTIPAKTGSFSDVPTSNAFVEDIRWLADLKVTTGYDDGTFRPTDPVSRQAMAAFLYRFAGSPDYTPPATTPFLDVAGSHSFYKQIAWLADAGISTGTTTPSGALFNPANPVSRQAMAAFLHRQHTSGYTVVWVAASPQPAPQALQDPPQSLLQDTPESVLQGRIESLIDLKR